MNRVSKMSVVVACVCFGLLSWAGGAAADSGAVEVTLTAEADGAGGCKINVSPENATISRERGAGPSRVNWVVKPNPDLGDLFWELRYDPGKGDASKNYFGGVDITCGKPSKNVKPEKPTIPNAEWPYMVTVYSCKDGNKYEYMCMVDPRIKWND